MTIPVGNDAATGQRVSDEQLDRWVEVSEGQTGAILTWPEMRDLIADLHAAREENRQLRERIESVVAQGQRAAALLERLQGGGSSD